MAVVLMKNYRLFENHFEPFMINFSVGGLKDLSWFSHQMNFLSHMHMFSLIIKFHC